MAVFIQLQTSAFDSTFAQQAQANQGAGGSGGSGASRAGKTVARRPVRGIEIKDDTYASLKIVQASGAPLPLMDSSSSTGTSTDGITNFILQSVQEQRMERNQIVETFGDTYVFFFGESPRFLDCSATLINTNDFSWRAEWWENYEKYLRGTKLVEMGARCYMAWDDNVVEGYMMMATAQETSEAPYLVQLQFKFFVTNYRNISLSNVAQYPVRTSVVLPDASNPTDGLDNIQNYYGGQNAAQQQADAGLMGSLTIGASLQSGGLTPGPLLSPVATQIGPNSYAFGAVQGGSISAILGPDVGDGFGAGLVADIGLGGGNGPTLFMGSYGTGPLGTSPDINSIDDTTGSIFGAGIGVGVNSTAGFGAGIGVGIGFGDATTISQQLQSLPPGVLTDPSIWNALQSDPSIDPNNPTNTMQPGVLRGLIAQNNDEYIYGSDGYMAVNPALQDPNDPSATDGSADMYDPLALDNGLEFNVISTLLSIGADADNEDTLNDLGLGPNFSPAYVASVASYAGALSSKTGYGSTVGTATSFGGATNRTVSFGPVANASLTTSSVTNVGLSAVAGYYANTGDNSSFLATSPYYQYSDPLGAIYGNNATQGNGYDPDRYQYVEGAGDPTYGYSSPYGDVGYGMAGYGDFGGSGFGSGSSTGDPGYLNPQQVNVTSTDTNAVAALNQVNFDGTALTPGPSLGNTATQGAASINVTGAASAFAVTSLSGSLSDWVVAAANQTETTPYGQPATTPGSSAALGTEIGYSVYQQNKAPVTKTYVAAVATPTPLASSSGFTFFGFS